MNFFKRFLAVFLTVLAIFSCIACNSSKKKEYKVEDYFFDNPNEMSSVENGLLYETVSQMTSQNMHLGQSQSLYPKKDVVITKMSGTLVWSPSSIVYSDFILSQIPQEFQTSIFDETYTFNKNQTGFNEQEFTITRKIKLYAHPLLKNNEYEDLTDDEKEEIYCHSDNFRFHLSADETWFTFMIYNLKIEFKPL